MRSKRKKSSSPLSRSLLSLLLLLSSYPFLFFALLSTFLFLLPVYFGLFGGLDPELLLEIPRVPLEFGNNKCLLFVFFNQKFIVRIRHLGWYALKYRFSHRIEIARLVPVVILADPRSGCGIRMRLAEACDVDEETVANVDPPRIDDVHAVAALALPDPRVDVEEELSLGSSIGKGVDVVSLVVVIAEVFEGCSRDLSVQVPVPWQSLGCALVNWR